MSESSNWRCTSMTSANLQYVLAFGQWIVKVNNQCQWSLSMQGILILPLVDRHEVPLHRSVPTCPAAAVLGQ
jgi:hypothetical protein